MILQINYRTFFIGAIATALMIDALPLTKTHIYSPNQPTALDPVSSHEMRLRANKDFQRQMYRNIINVRDPNPLRTLDGDEILSRGAAIQVLDSIRRQREEDSSWPGLRREDVIMSHEEEMACRERGGTPERIGNGRAGCSMNPVPIRRTVWRKRKSNVDGVIWKGGDGHGR